MTELPYTPPHQYSIDEFVGHFDHFVRSSEGTNKAALIKYFASRYPNRAEGLYKLNRFAFAFDYLARHLQDFEQFVVVGGEQKALISKPVVVALARYFGSIPEQHLNEEPEVKTILKLAKEEQ